MDVLMTQRRPLTRLQRPGVTQPATAKTRTATVEPALPPPEAVHLWMGPVSPVQSSDADRAGPSATRAALAYKAAATAVKTK